MGYIKHNAIIITSWKPEAIDQAHAKATDLGMVVSPVVESGLNGYGSILVAPDGSKEGWPESNTGDKERAALRAWLRSQRYEDGSSCLEWCEVSYGSDDESAEIVEHAWGCPYCGNSHGDAPCPVRAADAERYAAAGREIYPNPNRPAQ